jgi:hypothetical protein
MAFVFKLYEITNASEGTTFIRWSEDGTKFAITNPERFAGEVLPHFFKHRNYTSFLRQLNVYGEYGKARRFQSSKSSFQSFGRAI